MRSDAFPRQKEFSRGERGRAAFPRKQWVEARSKRGWFSSEICRPKGIVGIGNGDGTLINYVYLFLPTPYL